MSIRLPQLLPLALALASAGCAAPGPVRPPAPPAAAEPAADGALARTAGFAFHSHVLLNLHHFLYQCAKAEAGRDRERVFGAAVDPAELALADSLAGTERAAWRAALAHYRADAIGRDLLFDGELYRLKTQLAGVVDPDGPWPAELDPAYANALHIALPVYRRNFWDAHDRANRAWAAAAVALLARYEDELLARVTDAFGGPWPDPPVRVDLVRWANWAGAYATGDPDQVVLSTADPDLAGHGALEGLFHEGAHTGAVTDAFGAALAAALAEEGADAPRDLWHLFLFLTAGGAVERTLAADGIDGYEHYGARTGVYRRGSWGRMYPHVAPHWDAVLDGALDRPTALARIAAAVRDAPPLFEPRTRTDARGVEQVLVPTGRFRMGTVGEPALEPPAWARTELASERPAHLVEITRPFWLDRTEVTVAQFDAFVADGGYARRELWSDAGWAWLARQDVAALPQRLPDERPDHPRVGVTWYEAEAYARWRGGRLPTEAEWEWAARGPEARVFPWGDAWDPARAHVVGLDGPQPVGALPSGASWVGALDLAGNAMEWVADWLDVGYYERSPRSDPPGPEAGTRKVEKGGWWGGPPFAARAAYRHFEDPPDYRDHHIGFRVASDG